MNASRAAFACSLLAASCGDPQLEEKVNALGAEDPDVPAGELHRPGQPCVLCHSQSGTAETIFSFGGTVYRTRDDTRPQPGVRVRFIDFTGLQHSTITNAAGNFYVSPSDYAPSFPIWVKLEYEDTEIEMTSAIARERSCSECHVGSGSPSHVNRVYLWEEGS